MKIVVTGGAGYVGWSLVDILRRRPEVVEIAVLDNFRRANYAVLSLRRLQSTPKIQVFRDDVLNSRGLRTMLNGADVVCHLAAVARSPYSKESPHEFDQINHWGSAEICYAVEDLGIPRLVYMSSGAVYGQGDAECTPDSPVNPISAYGDSKFAGERQVERLAKRTDVFILRSGTVYGLNPCVRFDTALNRFCLHAVLNKPLLIHGDGQQRRAVIHIDTVARLLAHAALGDLDPGLYHAVDANPSIAEAVSLLRTITPIIEYNHVNQRQRLGSLILAQDARLSHYQQAAPDIRQTLATMLVEMGFPLMSNSTGQTQDLNGATDD